MIFNLAKFRDFSNIISPITKSNTYYLSIVNVQNNVSLNYHASAIDNKWQQEFNTRNYHE